MKPTIDIILLSISYTPLQHLRDNGKMNVIALYIKKSRKKLYAIGKYSCKIVVTLLKNH